MVDGCNVSILKEDGLGEAILGLSLSYNIPIEKAYSRATALVKKDYGHNKFLESVNIVLDVTMPRYWWQEMDTYRVGITKQSEATMHTILKHPLTKKHFVNEQVEENYLVHLNYLRDEGDIVSLKRALPEGFLQRRIISTNYKTLRNIIRQRLSHRLPEWTFFCNTFKHASLYWLVEDLYMPQNGS